MVFKFYSDRYLRQWERNEKFNYSHQDLLEPYYDETDFNDNYTKSFSCYNSSSSKRNNSVRSNRYVSLKFLKYLKKRLYG